MRRLNNWWILTIFLTTCGICFTFYDYSLYHKTETQNYGHGPGEIKSTWDLSENYQNEFVGIRVKYPNSWQVKTFISQKNTYGQIAAFSNSDFTVSIFVQKSFGTLKDLEDQHITSLKPNERLYGERSYLNTERLNMTVINFQRFSQNQTYMVSHYLAKKNDNLFILEFISDLANYSQNSANFQAMAKTLVLL